LRRLEAGDQLGRYKILKRLGAGAMGEVYLAEDPQIGRQIALKTVLVQEGRAQELEERKRRLLREARAAGKLLHPQVIALFDAGEDQGILYLAFEFVEGKDLADRVAEGPQLLLGEALAIVRQAAEGLDYAHRQGVVHRDIKPSNLMITADGRVKIADFGIARVADQTSDLTMTGSVVGSPHYMSPEQIRGEELDGRTDIFSLGVLLYEILCRRRPFEGETLTTLVYQILNQEPTPLVVRRPDLGPRLEQLVRRMLHKDRDQRFASAAEVVREIAVCERELSADQLSAAAVRDESPSDATVRMADRPPAVPPPAPAPGAAAPAPPAAAPAARAVAPVPVAAAAPAPKSRLALVAVVVALLLALLVGGGLVARKFVAGLKAKSTTSGPETVEKPAPSPTTPAVTRPAPPVQTARAEPLVQPEAASTAPATAPSTNPRPAVVAEPGTRAKAPSEVAPTPTPVEPRREPAPVRPRVERERPRPVPATEPEEPEPAPPEPSPREEPREAVVERVPVDREMRTGMNLSFDLQPKEAAEQIIVKFDRTVIGLASDWNAKKRDGRAYSVPDSGAHVLSFLVDGNVVYRIRIEAEPGGPNPTTISLSLPQFGKRGRRSGR
jgi:serine/threonine-protein kinase